MEGTKMGVLVLAAVCCVGLMSAGTTASASARVPAMYVFGDSTADVGNNNYLPGDRAKANFPPHGIDYPQHKPTGRFSNGYNVMDYFAKKLGFNKSPPAYLSITGDSHTFKGVNFASSGSGILDITGRNYSISLNTQIRYFGDVVSRLRRRMGATAADAFLSKSLFVLSTGNNDMFGLFFTSGAPNQTQATQLTGLLATQFRAQLQGSKRSNRHAVEREEDLTPKWRAYPTLLIVPTGEFIYFGTRSTPPKPPTGWWSA